jgi:hypothetical protein
MGERLEGVSCVLAGACAKKRKSSTLLDAHASRTSRRLAPAGASSRAMNAPFARLQKDFGNVFHT